MSKVDFLKRRNFKKDTEACVWVVKITMANLMKSTTEKVKELDL